MCTARPAGGGRRWVPPAQLVLHVLINAVVSPLPTPSHRQGGRLKGVREAKQGGCARHYLGVTRLRTAGHRGFCRRCTSSWPSRSAGTTRPMSGSGSCGDSCGPCWTGHVDGSQVTDPGSTQACSLWHDAHVLRAATNSIAILLKPHSHTIETTRHHVKPPHGTRRQP